MVWGAYRVGLRRLLYVVFAKKLYTDSPNNVCFGTRVNPCCSTVDFGKGNLVSSNKVSVAGEDVTVAYYLTQDSTESKYSILVYSLHVSSILHLCS